MIPSREKIESALKYLKNNKVIAVIADTIVLEEVIQLAWTSEKRF
jgi:hypothetical protein